MELKSMLLSKSLSVEIHKKKLTKQEQSVRDELEVEMRRLGLVIAEKDEKIKQMQAEIKPKTAPRLQALTA